MSWLSKLLQSSNQIEFGKDIKLEFYDNYSDFPKEGKCGVIYATKGWLDVKGDKYIWDRFCGTEMYMKIVNF